ncbi:MAG: hypothetical protein K8T90_18930 [Planctomycetes bacterium]|nr:hypothetical protein [Planctomycetota bacterium]
MSANGAGRATPRNLGRAAVVAAFAALIAVPAGAAWDGTQKIRLGDSIGAEFAAAAGSESHVFSFFAPETTKVSTLVKPLLKTSGLTAAVSLVDAAGANVDVGTAGTGTAIKNFALTNRGSYGFKVVSTAGTGAYRLTTKATWPKTFATQLTTATTYEFGAPAGSTVDIAVKKAKNSAAVPTVSAVSGPNGALTITAGALIRKLAIPADGRYRVTVANSGTANDPIDLVVKFTAPKGTRTWGFGVVDIARGTADDKRQLWLSSKHSAVTTEPFAHWNNDIPAVVPTSCAKCHSGAGYRDFLGVDGTAAGVVNVAPAVGRTVDCETCHNAGTANLTQVTFTATGNTVAGLLPATTPKTITGIGDESRCMICHQGRESKYTLDSMIALAFSTPPVAPATLATLNPIDVDLPVTTGTNKIGFKNIHYFAAAATLYGREAGVGYEYTGKAYEKKFTHVEDYDTCIRCHDPHTLKVKVNECVTCHVIAPANATDPAKYELAIDDLHKVRMAGTVSDFDGDGNATEGMYEELVGTSDVLLKTIKEYAKDVNASPIGYDGAVYPYFFIDTNENGTIDTGEGGYAKWTARLVKAAFNYQMFKKDPGGFAHNGKYLNELMYDSIADLDAHALVDVTVANGYTVNLASMVRNDIGHFDSSADAYTDWADDTGVSSSCAKCHSLEGFRFRVKYGMDTTISQPTVSGMPCESCHVVGADFKTDPARVVVTKVIFPYQLPSGTTIIPSTQAQINAVSINTSATTPDESFICMTCHQGRQSMLSINAGIVATTNQQAISFPNVHYFPAGATQYATKAGVGYVWTGIADEAATAFPARTYVGPWTHYNTTAWTDYNATTNPTGGMPNEARCAFCHMQDGSHKFEPETGATCTICHGASTDIETYRATRAGLSDLTVNMDGDAATTKLSDEVHAYQASLLKALEAYATRKGKGKPLYDGNTNPYWFRDNDGNGLPDDLNADGVITTSDRYAQFDKFMIYGAHNYQFTYKDPGSWAHNGRSTFELLYDSIDYLDDGLWNASPKNATNAAALVRP